jgi:hypothetical protein
MRRLFTCRVGDKWFAIINQFTTQMATAFQVFAEFDFGCRPIMGGAEQSAPFEALCVYSCGHRHNLNLALAVFENRKSLLTEPGVLYSKSVAKKLKACLTVAARL